MRDDHKNESRDEEVTHELKAELNTLNKKLIDLKSTIDNIPEPPTTEGLETRIIELEKKVDRPHNEGLETRIIDVEKKVDLLWRDDPRCKDFSQKLVYCKLDLKAREDLSKMLKVKPESHQD